MKINQSIRSLIAMIFVCILLITPLMTIATPPKTIPPELCEAFTWNGAIPVAYIYFNEYYPSHHPLVYTYEQIETNIVRAKARETNHYGITDVYLYQALDKHVSAITGKNVAVMGSVVPWYESILLAYGAFPLQSNIIKSLAYIRI